MTFKVWVHIEEEYEEEYEEAAEPMEAGEFDTLEEAEAARDEMISSIEES